MVGGSRLGPAVLPCQHARRPGTRGRRRGVRDGRALACLQLWPGRSSPASRRVGAAKRIWGGAHGGGAGREPRGRCAGIGTCAAQTPATCRARSQRPQDCPARRWGRSPRHRGAGVSPVRAPAHTSPPAPRASAGPAGTPGVRERKIAGRFHLGDPLPPIHILPWA